MLQKVLYFPNQVAEAYSSLSNQKELPREFKKKFSSIVLLGMGGSGIVSDFVRVLLRNSPIPVHVCKNSSPPKFVNEQTLVIAVTYSGKTHETVDALNASLLSGAKCIVITSSRELGSHCEEKNIPCIFIPWNSYSRASFGYILIPVLGVLHKLGLFPTIDSDVSEAISILQDVREECDPNVPSRKNPARILALSLNEKLPILYGEYNFTDVIALRWKHQLNENAKVHCYCEVFPELLHNEIESWGEGPSYVANQSCSVMFLRDSMHEHENNLEERIEAAKYLAESKGMKILELWTRGKSDLARLFSLTYLVDFVSLYLANLRNVNPEVIGNIDFVKKRELTQIKGEKE